MDVARPILLGILQGVTEFLPISSSGHLVLLQNLLGLKEPEILFDVAVHVGTLVAVITVFRREVVQLIRAVPAAAGQIASGRGLKGAAENSPEAGLLFMIILATLVTGALGLLGRGLVEELFASVTAVGWMLAATGLILGATYFAQMGERDDVGPLAALLIGLGQALAIAPGISRSGTTIAVGLFCGLKKDLSARFSFLISIPAILGALALELSHVEGGSFSAGQMLLAAVFAAASGYIALRVLLKVVDRGKLWVFAPYCLALGLILVLG